MRKYRNIWACMHGNASLSPATPLALHTFQVCIVVYGSVRMQATSLCGMHVLPVASSV